MIEANFPNEMESILASLSYVYKENQQTLLLEIIVKGEYKINLFHTTDNWNGGTYTHTITFLVSEELYRRIYSSIAIFQDTLCTDINNSCHLDNESIDRVDIEINPTSAYDWRRKSGLLEESSVSLENQEKLWGNHNNYRIFISHKTEYKKQASELKNQLLPIGVSCFVAHEDIAPTSNWINEILSALFSADALLALITDKYYESQWTDQEIGCAIGRHIPIFAFRLGNDPHGFIGRFQAITSSWEKIHINLIPYLAKEPKMKNAIIQATQNFNCFVYGRFLIHSLNQIEHYEESEIDQLVCNYNNSPTMKNCWALNQNQFLNFINKKSKRKFTTNGNNIITLLTNKPY